MIKYLPMTTAIMGDQLQEMEIPHTVFLFDVLAVFRPNFKASGQIYIPYKLYKESALHKNNKFSLICLQNAGKVD